MLIELARGDVVKVGGVSGLVKLPIPGFGRNFRRKGHPAFVKGNTYALASAMTEDSHKRRLKGLYKGWAIKDKIPKGEVFMGVKATIRKKTRIRARLHRTVAKEALEIQNIARTHANEVMIRLAEIVNDRSTMDSVAIAAGAVLLDRAYGKAMQTNVNANVNADGKPSEITARDLHSRVEQALKRIAELTGGTVKAPKSKERPADVRQPDRDTDSSTKH